MELIKNGDRSKKKAGNEIICPRCGAEHKVTIEDIVTETISHRVGCDHIYCYHCSWCNQKIQISDKEYERLMDSQNFWVIKHRVYCSNPECKAVLELLPENFFKVRKGFLRYSKQRMWECPHCNKKNYIHKSKLSSRFNESIKSVITIKDE